MIEFETKISEIIQRTKNVKSFRFIAEQDLDFKPGQFFFVKIKVDGAERTKHFSFSNSPTEKGYAEFTKRMTDSEYSTALDKLKQGDWAKLRLPFGAFTFSGEYKKIAFLSGGIGITPIRSICKFVTDSGLATDMVLLYGSDREKDIIFRQDLDQMVNQNKNLRVVYTLTSPEIDKKSWAGQTGYIDTQMIQEEIPDYQHRIFYTCGPPKMVSALTGILKDKLHLAADKIKLENFTGY